MSYHFPFTPEKNLKKEKKNIQCKKNVYVLYACV